MPDSLSTWLEVREPFDWASRSARLAADLGRRLGGVRPLRVLDLGSGSGSNVRYLLGQLPAPQRWLAIDENPRLLEEQALRAARWGAERGCQVDVTGEGYSVRLPGGVCDVETRAVDLGDAGAAPVEGRNLVTASALLDLVSEAWLEALAASCCDAGAAVLFALTYDGRSSCDPAEPEDDLVRELMNQHQLRDKGLGGPAAGPGAHAAAARIFAASGYAVAEEATDWVLGPGDEAIQRQLIEGWVEAAIEQAPEQADELADWRRRRLDHVAAGRSRVRVGHHDLSAWPPPSRQTGSR